MNVASLLRSDVEHRVVGMATVDDVSVRTSVPARAGARPARWLVVALAATIGALLLSPSAATAQDSNSLQAIEPGDGETVGASPTEITLSFNQEIDAQANVVLAIACNNEVQETGLPEVDDDRLIVTVPVIAVLPRAACFISWQLLDEDGAVIIADQSTFSVTNEPPPSSPQGDATTTTDPIVRVPIGTDNASSAPTETEGSIEGALWFGRLVSTIGILVLFGGLALISIGWPEGPEYVVTVRFLRAVWVMALVGTILYLVAYSADFNGTSFGSGLSPSSWLDVKDDGWTGRGALFRLVFVAASGWVAFRPERIIDPASAMWAWGLPGFSLVAVALTRVEGPAAALGFLVGLIHVFAVAIWIGGVALLARVVLAGPGEEDLVQATRAFSRVSVPATVVVAVTGLIQTVRLVGDGLFSSSHGQVLLLKVVAVAAMLAVALAVRQQVTMRLDRAHELTVALSGRFRRAFSAEATLGIVVLAFSGWMLGLTPAQVDPLAGVSYARSPQLVDQASGIDVTVHIDPAVTGRNLLRVEVEAPATGIANLLLRFIPPPGANAFIVEQRIPLTTAGTATLDIEDGIPFGASGVWTLEVEASTTIGDLVAATRTFEVRNEDGTVDTVLLTPDTTISIDIALIDPSSTVAPFPTLPPATTLPIVPETSEPAE
jgi:copper transport protein